MFRLKTRSVMIDKSVNNYIHFVDIPLKTVPAQQPWQNFNIISESELHEKD